MADIIGTYGDDYLWGTPDDDRIEGQGGNDSLYGSFGSDLLIGGLGSDRLDGALGDDTYEFSSGENGYDFIWEGLFGGEAGGFDTIRLNAAYDPATMQLWRFASDLSISFSHATGSDQILVVDHFVAGGQYAMEQIAFSDGTVWNATAIANRIMREDVPMNMATANGDTIGGTSRSDFIDAYAGDDTVSGGGGSDTLYGNTGDDVLFGNAGDDSLFGDSGNDVLSGNVGDDSLYGGEGTDDLAGGAGYDSLEGGAGNDTYRFNRGDGVEFIVDDSFYGDQNRLIFGADISVDDVQLRSELGSGYLEIRPRSGSSDIDIIRFSNFDPHNANGPHAISYYEFADGTVLTHEELIARGASTVGTDMADVLYGTLQADSIYGNGGNDYIDGLEGDDHLAGGADDDVIYGGFGIDQLRGDAGNDNMSGGDGNDELIGGTGDDVLQGETGSDTYRFSRGDGADTIVEYWSSPDADSVVFGAGITINDVAAQRNGRDVVISVSDPAGIANSDGMTIVGWFDGQQVETFLFADGTALSAEQIQQMALTIYGTEGADTIEGWQEGSTIHALGGNDRITTLNGNDFVYAGDGDDTIDNYDGSNIIEGGAGNDIIRSIGHASYWHHDYYGWFSDVSSSLLYGDEGNDTILVSELGSNNLFGGAGDDVLQVGLYFSDPQNSAHYYSINAFHGGSGTDQMLGSAGRDIYNFNRGDGTDTALDNPFAVTVTHDVTGRRIEDLVLFGDGIETSHITTLRNGDDLIIAINDPAGVENSDRLIFQRWYLDAAYQIENFWFADGTRWTTSDLETLTNVAPVVAMPLSDLSINEDVSSVFHIPYDTFADANNDVLTLAVSNVVRRDTGASVPLPAWLSFDARTGTLTATPSNDDLGIYDITVTASDGRGGSVSTTLALNVQNTNDAPLVVSPISDQNANANAFYAFTVPSAVFTDVDTGDSLMYTATRSNGEPLPTWLTFNPATRTFSGVPGATDVGVLDVRVIATDAAGASASEDFALTIATLPRIVGTANGEYLVGTNNAEQMEGLAGNDRLDAYGGNDVLIGGAGNDILNGGEGVDTMHGGAGNDVYRIDTALDLVVELANEGEDDVNTSVSYTLPDHVERLTLNGSQAINGAGNELGNLLSGNGANNILEGRGGNDRLDGFAGDDTLSGGAGNDNLNGGSGNDTYIFNRGDGADRVNDNDATAGNQDRVLFDVNPLDVVFARSGSDLQMRLHGSSDVLTVNAWYVGSERHTEIVQTADGRQLLDTQVANLIQAMATFSANNGGITWDQAIDQRPQDVEAIISAYWQPTA